VAVMNAAGIISIRNVMIAKGKTVIQ